MSWNWPKGVVGFRRLPSSRWVFVLFFALFLFWPKEKGRADKTMARAAWRHDIIRLLDQRDNCQTRPFQYLIQESAWIFLFSFFFWFVASPLHDGRSFASPTQSMEVFVSD
jgi:hypothetical protein